MRPREPGEDMTEGYQYLTTLHFESPDELRAHLEVLRDFLVAGSRTVTPEIQAAVDYFGFKVNVSDGHDAYDSFHDYYATPGKGMIVGEISNPTRHGQYGDLLVALDEAMARLQRVISDINDPAVKTPDVQAVRAYLGALREFLANDADQSPVALPAQIPQGLEEKIKRVDWSKISDEARKWAETISKILKIFHPF